MRTTLTLDPDVAERIRQEGRSGKRSQKEIINDALRRGLALQQADPSPPFVVQAHSSPFQAGIDRGKLNRLVDELEAGAFIERQRSSKE